MGVDTGEKVKHGRGRTSAERGEPRYIWKKVTLSKRSWKKKNGGGMERKRDLVAFEALRFLSGRC